MKRLALIFLILLASGLAGRAGGYFYAAAGGGGGGGPTLIDHTGAGMGINGGTTSAINTTGANFIVIAVSYYDGSSPTITVSDSKSNTWTALSTWGELTHQATVLYYMQGGTVGSGHTFTVAASSGYASMQVQAWSNIEAAPFDQENGDGEIGSATIQPGSITPGQGNVLVITASGNVDADEPITSVSDSFTISDSNTGSSGNFVGGVMAYRVITNGAAQNPTFTWSATASYASAAIASFTY